MSLRKYGGLSFLSIMVLIVIQVGCESDGNNNNLDDSASSVCDGGSCDNKDDRDSQPSSGSSAAGSNATKKDASSEPVGGYSGEGSDSKEVENGPVDEADASEESDASSAAPIEQDAASSSRGLENSGIGTPCESDSDCESLQYCHYDTQDYIGHGQCTFACDDSDTCKTNFGRDTFCIGANICVAECDFEDDCPEKTTCTDSGWCMRTGPGSGLPYCGGTPMPCSSLNDEQSCMSSMGCHSEGGCSGVSESCYSQFDTYSCESLDGCYWDSYFDECSGVSRSCSMYSFSTSCESQDGCRWDFDCTGTPWECSDFSPDPALCERQVGCSVIYP